jgi:hypothetical protein
MNRDQIDALRRDNYPSLELMLIALWEKIMEEQPDKAAALQVLKSVVDAQYPMPE